MTHPEHPLFELMPPPLLPVDGGDRTLEEAEEYLRIKFSSQYKLFLVVYGDGSIDGELGFFSYRASDQSVNFLETSTRIGPNDVTPLPMYPNDEASLLPIGFDGNGNTVFGVIEDGLMSEETYWIGNLRFGQWARCKGPFLDFLHRVLSGHEPYLDEEFWVSPLASTFVPANTPNRLLDPGPRQHWTDS